MALERFEKNPSSFDASQNHKILIPLNNAHYMMQINYSGFNPGVGTGFKLHKVASTNPVEDKLIEIAGSEKLINDANGIVSYSNVNPEMADFLVLEYTADGNNESPEFEVCMSARS